jgi:excisionase family DNA binding protein
MEVITIQTDAFKQIIDSIADIKQIVVGKGQQTPLSETWLDIQETCQLLKISKRTLQSYRDNGILPFSQIGGKIYFRAADIEEHLKKHYIKAFNPKK